MSDTLYEEMDVIEILQHEGVCNLSPSVKKIIAEISLKIIVNGEELVSVLCLNRQHEELALGFLFNEGVINSFEDVQRIEYIDRMQAVAVELKEGVGVDRRESLRSITSGCGKCYTYINPLKNENYRAVHVQQTFSAQDILHRMKGFKRSSSLFREVGGVHSLLLQTGDDGILIEDIGRHNCFDKLAGLLCKESRLHIAGEGILLVSGRISSEIVTKMIRMGVSVAASKSTPTVSAVKLAQTYNISLLGYVRDERGVVYSCPERIVL